MSRQALPRRTRPVLWKHSRVRQVSDILPSSTEDQAPTRRPWCCWRSHSHRVEALVPARDAGTDSWQRCTMSHQRCSETLLLLLLQCHRHGSRYDLKPSRMSSSILIVPALLARRLPAPHERQTALLWRLCLPLLASPSRCFSPLPCNCAPAQSETRLFTTTLPAAAGGGKYASRPR